MKRVTLFSPSGEPRTVVLPEDREVTVGEFLNEYHPNREGCVVLFNGVQALDDDVIRSSDTDHRCSVLVQNMKGA